MVLKKKTSKFGSDRKIDLLLNNLYRIFRSVDQGLARIIDDVIFELSKKKYIYYYEFYLMNPTQTS